MILFIYSEKSIDFIFFYKKNNNFNVAYLDFHYSRWDSNPYIQKIKDFKSFVSTTSTTGALNVKEYYKPLVQYISYIIFQLSLQQKVYET